MNHPVDRGGRQKVGSQPWLPLAISILSFLVSVVALWHTWLSPFHLEVIPGSRIGFAVQPALPDKLAALYVQLVFSNAGASTGSVDDISLIVRDTHSRKAVYRSFIEYPEMGTTNRGPEVNRHMFTAFTLNPRESLAKTIVCIATDDVPLDLSQGDYVAEPYIRLSGSNQWIRWEDLRFKVTDTDLQMIKEGIAAHPNGQFQVQIKRTENSEEKLRQLKSSH